MVKGRQYMRTFATFTNAINPLQPTANELWVSLVSEFRWVEVARQLKAAQRLKTPAIGAPSAFSEPL